jgi:hypothetical protein
MNHCSTSASHTLLAKFHNDPLKSRVYLPDGTFAVVVAFQNTDQGRVYKVQGIHRDGRFRALGLLSYWFAENELRLFYYLVSISPRWLAEQPQADTRNGAL